MKKRLLFSSATLAALGGVWLAGFKTRPALAQQASPVELNVPRAFGTLKGSDAQQIWFEAPDGSIRALQIVPDQGGTYRIVVTLVLRRT